MAKKRRGPRKNGLIEILKNKANQHHKEASCAWQGALEHARKCGEALNKIRWETDNWKKVGWKRWLNSNFDASYETAKVYIRIARKWNDPRLEAARNKGVVLKSIKSVFDILQGRPSSDSSQKSPNPNNVVASICRQDLRKKFTDALRGLSKDEFLIFENAFDYYWKKLSEKIYDDTCSELGFDLDEFIIELKEERGTLPEWNPINNRDAINGPPKRFMDIELKKQKVETRLADKKVARQKVHQALNKIQTA